MKPNASFEPQHLMVRAGLDRELKRAWQRLAAPGTWWSGEQRLAIAREARHASFCALCAQRREALSPFAINGHHDSLGAPSALSPPSPPSPPSALSAADQDLA